MNKKKPRLYNTEITAYCIQWASKFSTMIIKHKQTADYIHWASKIVTSANKHADKIIYKTDNTSIEFKKLKVSPAGELQRNHLSKMMRLRLFNTYILLTLKDKQADR